MSVKAEAGDSTGTKRERLPTVRNRFAGLYRHATDFGRVRGNGHTHTVLSGTTYRLCTHSGTSIVATVDNVDK